MEKKLYNRNKDLKPSLPPSLSKADAHLFVQRRKNTTAGRHVSSSLLRSPESSSGNARLVRRSLPGASPFQLHHSYCFCSGFFEMAHAFR